VDRILRQPRLAGRLRDRGRVAVVLAAPILFIRGGRPQPADGMKLSAAKLAGILVLGAGYLFLFAPILSVIVYSFNESGW